MHAAREGMKGGVALAAGVGNVQGEIGVFILMKPARPVRESNSSYMSQARSSSKRRTRRLQLLIQGACLPRKSPRRRKEFRCERDASARVSRKFPTSGGNGEHRSRFMLSKPAARKVSNDLKNHVARVDAAEAVEQVFRSGTERPSRCVDAVGASSRALSSETVAGLHSTVPLAAP